MDRLDALDRRMEELNRIEHDIDYGKPRKKPPLPAAPSSVQKAGEQIVARKLPPSSRSHYSDVPVPR